MNEMYQSSRTASCCVNLETDLHPVPVVDLLPNTQPNMIPEANDEELPAAPKLLLLFTGFPLGMR